MNEKQANQLLNIPNCLCYLRIILIPVFLYVYFHANSQSDYFLATAILVVSGLSDFLDGQIARRCHMVTDFGKIIDPIADKLTQFAVAIALLFQYPLMWVLLLIIVIKDSMIALVGLFLYEAGQKVKGASWWGKIATAYFYLVVIILVSFPLADTPISITLIITSSALMFLAFVLYAKELNVMYKQVKEEHRRER